MTPRREYGSGGTYQRKSDWRWVATLEAGYTRTGARRRVSVSTKGCEGGCPKRCPHRDAIKRKLRDRRNKLENDGAPQVSGRVTVKAWAEQWLDIEERRLRPSSYNATRVAVNRWIVPTIGHKRFDLLTPADIRAVANAQRKEGKSSSTQRRTHSVLVSLLKAATSEGYPVPPRVLVVEAPARAVSDRDALSLDQCLAVLEKASKEPDGSRWVAALLQGMRQGEALGLTWDEVDVERGTLTVSWQLQPLPYRIKRDRTSGFRIPDGYEARQVKGALHLVRPKSRAGSRVIPLVPWMATSLEAWRADCPDSARGLVWPTADGSPRTARADDAAWYALQEAAGVSHPGGRLYTLHEARHTTATLLLELGIDPAVIIAIMGHSSIVTSRGYQHVRTDHVLAALGKVAERLELG